MDNARELAAELIQRFPEVVEPLREGRLCITSIVELAKVITQENRADILPRFFHASKQEAKAVAAEICPQGAIPRREVVTAVAPTAARALVSPVLPSPVRQTGAEVRPVELGPSASVPAVVPQRTVAEPLTADLRRLHVTVSKRFMAKLEAARDALSHSHPGADAEAILEAGLDHIIPRARGGKSTVANLRVLCQPCNLLACAPALRRRMDGPVHESGTPAREATALRDGPRTRDRVRRRFDAVGPVRVPADALRAWSADRPPPRRCRFSRESGPGGSSRDADRLPDAGGVVRSPHPEK